MQSHYNVRNDNSTETPTPAPKPSAPNAENNNSGVLPPSYANSANQPYISSLYPKIEPGPPYVASAEQCYQNNLNHAFMRRKLIVIFTQPYRSKPGDDSSTRTWFNKCGESREAPGDDYYEFHREEINKLKAEGFKRGVQASSLTDVYARLNNYIQENNASKFSRLLETDFIYPERILLHSDYAFSGFETREIYHVRQNIVALFIDNNANFAAALIDSLLAVNNKSLYESFLKSFIKSELYDVNLFLWNENIKTKILTQLDNFKKHGHSLNNKNSEIAKNKGALAMALAEQLSTQVSQQPAAKSSDYKTRFENLRFNLELFRVLHMHDDVFASHRTGERKRMSINLLSVLSTVGIANFLNYAKTGNLLFFQNTTSQEKVLNIQAAIGFKIQ